MSRKSLRYLILAVFMVGFLVLEAQAQQLAKEQVLTIAFDAGDLQTLDPHRVATTVDRATVDMIFNDWSGTPRGTRSRLNRTWPHPGGSRPTRKSGPLPSGRESFSIPIWEIPGYEVTSEDIVYSFKRAADTKRSSYAGEYGG